MLPYIGRVAGPENIKWWKLCDRIASVFCKLYFGTTKSGRHNIAKKAWLRKNSTAKGEEKRKAYKTWCVQKTNENWNTMRLQKKLTRKPLLKLKPNTFKIYKTS